MKTILGLLGRDLGGSFGCGNVERWYALARNWFVRARKVRQGGARWQQGQGQPIPMYAHLGRFAVGRVFFFKNFLALSI